MQRCPGVWIYTQSSTHVQTFWVMTQTVWYRETQIHSDSFLFPSPEGDKHTPVYVFFFSIYPPPSLPSFLPFSKEPQPLALTLAPSPSLRPGMEADGNWHDGGFVLTVELMWPRGCRPMRTPDPMAHNAKCLIVERGWQEPKAVRGKWGEASCARR